MPVYTHRCLTSFIFFFHLTQIKHIWQLIFCAWKSGWASSQPSVSNFLFLHEACSNFVHQNLSQFFQLMNVYPVSTTAVYEIQMLWTAQVDRCLKVFTNTGRQHLFKLQNKMFSFSSYITTETTSNRQIPSSDIHNPISMEISTPVPFQPAWKNLQPIWKVNPGISQNRTSILSQEKSLSTDPSRNYTSKSKYNPLPHQVHLMLTELPGQQQCYHADLLFVRSVCCSLAGLLKCTSPPFFFPFPSSVLCLDYYCHHIY